ncbi:MAG: phospholipase A [Thermoanaerobaculaceae bacterium]|jgi:phospholipase A1|nr:phospholipase A [Thermoanaerobaculaceae bacterium]
MKRTTAAVILALCAAMGSGQTPAQDPEPVDVRPCMAIESDAQRLACYDRAAGRASLPTAQKKVTEAIPPPEVFQLDSRPTGATPGNVGKPTSLLDSRWELSRRAKLGTYNVRGYKPIYLMPAFVTDDPNESPQSPNPDNTVSTPESLDDLEAKFQLSLKTKVWQGVFGHDGDLWVAYTQSSRWQVYNSAESRPFRETNYEPEVMLVFDTHYEVLGWQGRLLGIGVNHQSNGRSNPLSRSWNRIIADVGFERDGWTVMVRPWWRISEPREDDDNPDISDYMGRGEVQVVYEVGRQELGLLLRHSLRGGSHSHGAAQLTWSFPMGGNFRGYLELFEGYGESMIDYNHKATYVGLGVSLLDWY